MTLKSRFPNLVVGILTRESVKKALTNGITADQARSHTFHSTVNRWFFLTYRSSAIWQRTRIHRCVKTRVIVCFSCKDSELTVTVQKPLLPVTVQDQVRLWELEKNRVKSQEGESCGHRCNAWACTHRDLTGYLYTAFASQADYEYVLDYAKKLDVVLWESAARRCFFGSIEGHANIRGFIERRTAGKVWFCFISLCFIWICTTCWIDWPHYYLFDHNLWYHKSYLPKQI